MRRQYVDQLRTIEESLARLQLLLMVREPTTGLAADAYEGLRKQVVASAGQRNAHLAQLARLDAELQRDASGESLGLLLRDLLNEAELVRIDEPVAEAFDVIDGKGDAFEVLEPAYVDRQTERVVRRGKARRCNLPVDAAGAFSDGVRVGHDELASADAVIGGSDR